MHAVDDAPERRILSALSGELELSRIGDEREAMAVALAGAKFFCHDLAVEALDRARRLGLYDQVAAVAEAHRGALDELEKAENEWLRLEELREQLEG